MSDQYDRFIDELINRQHFTDLNDALREEIRRDVRSRLDNFLLRRMVDSFSDEDADRFIELMNEKKSGEEIHHFAREHIDNYEEFVKKAFVDFRINYLGE
jgi:Arc/MetJ-type ribon-helix-helix transcriptional regulator